jgi:multidrug resistance efflux pump
VEEAEARLGYCSVNAPTRGVVLSTSMSPGQLVSTMVPVTLLTMVDDSARRVRASIDEGELSKVCLHQSARITADSVPGFQMDGVVETIGATVVDNRSARQFRQVMISVSGDHQQTPIGLRVSVQFSPCLPGQRGTAK